MASTDYMDKHAAAQKWGVSVQYAQRIIGRVRGAKKVLIHGRAAWVCPKDAQKPTGKP